MTTELEEELKRGSNLKLAQRHNKIISSPLIGDRLWEPVECTPGVTCQVSIRFTCAVIIPVDSYFVLELPNHGWKLPKHPNLTVKVPYGYLPFHLKSLWNSEKRVLEMWSQENELPADSPVNIIISGVSTPPCATSGGEIICSIYEKLIQRKTVPPSTRGGQLLCGPSKIYSSKILPGTIQGKKEWVARNYIPNTNVEVSLDFQCNGAIPQHGKILVELPDQGWQLEEKPHVVITTNKISLVNASWDKQQHCLEIDLDTISIPMKSIVSVTIFNVKTPPKEEESAIGRITTLALNGGVIDGPTNFKTSRTSALTQKEVLMASEAFDQLDENKVGQLPIDTIKDVLHLLSIHLSDSLYDQYIQKPFQQMNEEKNNEMNKQTFLKLFAQIYTPCNRFGQDLRVACGRGEIKKIVEFLQRGCNPNGHDGNGLTSLHYAAEFGKLQVMKSLLEYFPDLIIDAQDHSKWTPLMCAASNNRIEIVEWLLDHKANINASNEQQRTALHWAATKGFDQMCSILLLNEALIDLQDVSGWTPLHLAIMHKNIPTMKLLLEKGANQHLHDKLGYTIDRYMDEEMKQICDHFK